MSGFRHDVAAGSGNLVAEQVQSPNYDAATGTGWRISKSGTAAFYSIVLPDGQGVSVFFASTAPSTTHVGDLWYDTGNGLALYRWDGTSWVAYQIGTGAIADTAVTPAKISALTASLVGNVGTLNANPYFTGGDATGWTAFRGTFTVVSGSSVPSGAPYAYAGKYVNDGTGDGAMQEKDTGGPFAVTPGQQYLVTAWAYSTTGSVMLGFDWLNGSTYVSTSTENFTITADTWTQVTTVQTAPASGVTGGYGRLGSTTGDSGTTYGQAIITLPQVPGALIEAGTVTASQIAAGTITAALLAAGIVVAGIVDATTITGATFVSESTAGGYYQYNGTPGANTLSASVTEQTADSYGNQTISPVGTYVQVGATWYAAGLDGQGILWHTSATDETTGWTQEAQLIWQPGGLQLQVGFGGHLTVSEVNTRTVIQADTAWTDITLDSGWSTASGYEVPGYRLLPDGDVEFRGLAVNSSSLTATTALNSGAPLPAAYRPAAQKIYRGADRATSRGGIQLDTAGVLSMTASASYPASHAELDGRASL